jgi:adenine C2-methylase RlmN of 23S rRNA A2503 and tRNA A37
MRPMDATMIDEHLENIDRRLTSLEQILPTLATKDELTTLATKEELSAAVALLATKEELRAAVAPLATKDDIHELRRHMEVLIEDQRSDTRLLAEHLSVVMSRLTDQ